MTQRIFNSTAKQFSCAILLTIVAGLVSAVAAEPGAASRKAPASDPDAPLPAIASTAMVKPPRQVTMVQDGFLWIDAEDFADYGGWQLDTQFVHLVGSAYLLAPGVGTPVKDATTTLEVRTPGKYRLWVRAKNWYKPCAPGRFQVSVNGRPSPLVFGRRVRACRRAGSVDAARSDRVLRPLRCPDLDHRSRVHPARYGRGDL